MKHLFVTMLTLTLLLAGCAVQYGDQFDNNASKNSVTETVEIEQYSPDKTDAVAFSNFELATVINIIDGDTVDVIKQDGKSSEVERIRIILVNSPESVGKYEGNAQPYGVEASNFTKDILLNKDIWLEYDVEKVDRYGRTLAYVWLDEVSYEYNGEKHYEKEIMFNEILLKHGLAHVAVYQPNVKYEERFYAIENEAKQNRIGIWK